MAKRPSGGKRAVAKKHRQRKAERKRTGIYGDDWVNRYRAAVGEPPLDDPNKGFGWLARALLFAADDAMTDPGLPVESRREQLTRIAPQLVKAMEPAKLAQELIEFQRVLEELKANAAPVDPREDGESTPRAPLQ